METLKISIGLLIIGSILIGFGLRKQKQQQYLVKHGRRTTGVLHEVKRQCAIYRFTAESTGHLYEAKGYFTDFETIPNTIYITYLPENPSKNMLGSASTEFYSLIYLILPGLMFMGIGIYLLPM